MGLELRVIKMHALAGVVVYTELVEEAQSQSCSSNPQGQPGIQVPHRQVPAWMQSPLLATCCQGVQEHNSISVQSRVLLNERVWCQEGKKKSPISDVISIPRQNPRQEKGTNGAVH